jgi:hypothetical protein
MAARRPVGNAALDALRKIDALAEEASKLADKAQGEAYNPALQNLRLEKIARCQAEIRRLTMVIRTGRDEP